MQIIIIQIEVSVYISLFYIQTCQSRDYLVHFCISIVDLYIWYLIHVLAHASNTKESETTENRVGTNDQFQMMFKAFHAMGLNPEGSTVE